MASPASRISFSTGSAMICAIRSSKRRSRTSASCRMIRKPSLAEGVRSRRHRKKRRACVPFRRHRHSWTCRAIGVGKARLNGRNRPPAGQHQLATGPKHARNLAQRRRFVGKELQPLLQESQSRTCTSSERKVQDIRCDILCRMSIRRMTRTGHVDHRGVQVRCRPTVRHRQDGPLISRVSAPVPQAMSMTCAPSVEVDRCIVARASGANIAGTL